MRSIVAYKNNHTENINPEHVLENNEQTVSYIVFDLLGFAGHLLDLLF